MNGNLFLKIIEVFFLCFGLISFFHSVSDWVLNRYCKQKNKGFHMLYIPEKTETLEADIRCSIQKSLAERRVLVIIHGELPEEDTFVLWRLCDPYEHIFIARKEDAEAAFLKACIASSENLL